MTTRIVLHNALAPNSPEDGFDEWDTATLCSPPVARQSRRQSTPHLASGTWTCARADPNYVNMDWKDKNLFKTVTGSSYRFSIPRIMGAKTGRLGRRSCSSILPTQSSFMERGSLDSEESYLSTVKPHVAMMYAKLDRLKRQKQEKQRLIHLLEDMELNFLGPKNSTYTPHAMDTTVNQDYQLCPGHHETQLKKGDNVTIYGYLGCSRWRCSANKLSCQCDKEATEPVLSSSSVKSLDKLEEIVPVPSLSKSTESLIKRNEPVLASKSFDDIFSSTRDQQAEVERLSYSSGCVYTGIDTTASQYKQTTAPSHSALSFTLNIEKSLYCKQCDRPMIPLLGSIPSSLLPFKPEQELLKEPSDDTFSLRSWSTLSTEFNPERLHEVSCSESGRGSLYSEDDVQFTADSGYSELFSFKRGGSAELIYTVKKLTLGEPFPEVLTTHTQTLPTQGHGIQLKSFSSEKWGNFVFGVEVVKDSPADKAGIKPVVEIIAVNKEPVMSLSDLSSEAGGTFTLTYIQGHAPMSLYSLLATKAQIGSAFDQLEVSLEDISDQESSLLKKYPSLQPRRIQCPVKVPKKIEELSESNA